MIRDEILDFWNILPDKSSVYQIKISGKVTSTLLAIVDDIQIQRQPGKDEINLIGCFPDQSALLGLLNALNEIRYEILSVRILDTD
ncbi:hypothetical protein JYB62_18685 [Algoriphagus lutimaris]|uniref:hypothetical protein n=1 Tax=Algoriphagus lutimaris TaxID=613197 RepID=UPI00196B016C|nr:hypothetical protein [Algoriphagus lutimaris]MBN3522038.1 hypothetical protein [Algoriphagus lutimaris]